MRARVWALLALGAALRAEGFSSRSELLLYRSDYVLDRDNAWNPGNRLVQQPGHISFGEWRPDVAWRDDRLELALRPRVLAEDSSKGFRREAWLNEGWLRFRPVDGLSLQAGREALLWGPSMFWNPSNPFFTDNGKDNPKREISGKSFLKGRWQWGGHWALEGIAQMDRGHEGEGVAQRQALKLDWTGSETHAALVGSRKPRASAEWRGFAQWTLSDEGLLYGEGGWVNRDTLLLATEAPTPTGWQLSPCEPGKALNLVVGAAWTFGNGCTLNGEFYQHGSGYTRSEGLARYAMAQALGAQWASPSAGLAMAQLGSLLDPGTTPAGRQMLGLQLREGSGKAHEWVLRYARNLSDRSGEGVAQLRVDVGDRVQLWGHVMLRHGGPEADGGWLQGSATLGVSWFMW